MGSFKLKLVTWFALLALVPLAVAFYGYDSLTKRSETGRADAALDAGLRGVVAAYAARLDAATAEARQLALDPALQRALRRHDRQALGQVRRGSSGRAAQLPARWRRAVAVLDHGRVLGSVAVPVPVDPQLVRVARVAALAVGPARRRALRAGSSRELVAAVH